MGHELKESVKVFARQEVVSIPTSKIRRDQIGTGDRSEKIRTYNYPQNRVTDHRINFSVHNLEQVMLGCLDEIIEALTAYYKEEQLKHLATSL